MSLDIMFIGLIMALNTQNAILIENDKILSDMDSQMVDSFNKMGKMIPILSKAHNQFLEGSFTDDPELMSAFQKFRDVMANMTDSGKLDKFFECSNISDPYIINFPIMDDIFAETKNMIGFEMVLYDMDDGFKVTDRIYLTKDRITYEKVRCAFIIYNPKTNFFDLTIFNTTFPTDRTADKGVSFSGRT